MRLFEWKNAAIEYRRRLKTHLEEVKRVSALPNALYIGVGLLGVGLLGLVAGKENPVEASNRPDPTPRSLSDVTSSREKLTVSQSQDARVLIAEARERHPSREISVEEMTAARLIASEHGSANAATAACIVDAELNRAERKGKSLLSHLTAGTAIYGRQGRHGGITRPAATRQNPTLKHLEIAQAVLGGDARGISRGAERFFDPKAQLATHRTYRAAKERGERARIIASCHPLGTLKAWSYNLPKCGPNRCCSDLERASEFGMPDPTAQRGPRPESWVGPIPGVNPEKLMLMRPSRYNAEHDRLYNAARRIIEEL